MQPKVVIDARMVTGDPHGIGKYTFDLIQGLSSLLSADEEKKYQLNALVGSNNKGIFSEKLVKEIEIDSPFLNSMELLEIPKVLKKINAHLYHSPSFSSLFYCPCPWMVTVHDLNHLSFGSFPKKTYYQLLLKPFIRRAEKVLTVSKFSQNEISNWSKLPASKIDIAYNAITHVNQKDGQCDEELIQVFGLKKEQFFFALSNPKPHKNIKLLIKAYLEYQKQINTPLVLPLVLNLTEKEFNSLGFEKVPEGVVLLGKVNEASKVALLKFASAFLFPSLYEGFGRPPLEAALYGTPTVVSDILPHKEALSELQDGEVKFLSPLNSIEWTNELCRIHKQKKRLVSDASRKRIGEKFSTVRLAKKMNETYLSFFSSQFKGDL